MFIQCRCQLVASSGENSVTLNQACSIDHHRFAPSWINLTSPETSILLFIHLMNISSEKKTASIIINLHTYQMSLTSVDTWVNLDMLTVHFFKCNFKVQLYFTVYLRGQRTSLVLNKKVLLAKYSFQYYPIQSPVYSAAFASSIVVSLWVTAGGWSREMLACVTGQIIKCQTSEVDQVWSYTLTSSRVSSKLIG